MTDANTAVSSRQFFFLHDYDSQGTCYFINENNITDIYMIFL